MLKELLKKNKTTKEIALVCFVLYRHTLELFTKRKERESYFKQIENIKREKEIVVKLSHGGLGDCLVFTSLPRLLKEKYGVDFYLSEESRSIFRHPDFLKLAFELNPFFKGFKVSSSPFELKIFSRDLPLRMFLSDKGGENIVVTLEKQFDIVGKGLPELYYEPKRLEEFGDTILVDLNWVFGKTHNLHYSQELVDTEIKRHLPADIVYSNPKSQDLFTFIDMIHSSKYFIGLISGQNAVLAGLGKEATIILPEDLEGGSMSNFLFPQAPITYLRKKSLRPYFR